MNRRDFLKESMAAGAALHLHGFSAAPSASVTADEQGVTVLLVDTDRVTRPIDRGIYGQFLEHIYHSVEDGLFAEQIRGAGFGETANRNFNTLRAMLQHAYKRGKCTNNAAWDSVEKISNTARVGTEVLTIEEAQRFWAACPEDFAALVYGAITTGCRYGELCSMRVDAFQPDRNCIVVMQGKTKHEKCIYLLPEETEWFTRHTMGRKPSDPMFVRIGDPMRDRKEESKAGWWGRSHQKERMAEALKLANIKRDLTFRDLRRSFGSWLANQGAPMDVIAKQLGHRSTRITARHYTQFTPEYLAAQVLARKPAFSPQKQAAN